MLSAVLSLTPMKPGVVEVSVQPPGGRQVFWGHHGKGCGGAVPQELGPGTADGQGPGRQGQVPRSWSDACHGRGAVLFVACGGAHFLASLSRGPGLVLTHSHGLSGQEADSEVGISVQEAYWEGCGAEAPVRSSQD